MSDLLRSRLNEMRVGLIKRLEKRIEGGDLALLGTVHGALSAVDAVPEEGAPVARAVVADDGEVIRLMFYAEDGAACGLELAPAHAVNLAGRLIAAASTRLTVEGHGLMPKRKPWVPGNLPDPTFDVAELMRRRA